MKTLRIFCLWMATLFFFTGLYGDPLYSKDDQLVQRLQQNKKRLIVFRHNESLNNYQDIVTASRSPGYSLTAAGRKDLKVFSQKFLNQGITIIYTSPMFRSMQATQILGATLTFGPTQLVAEERLSIQTFGTYEGRSFDDYYHLFSSLDDMLEGSAPQGEPAYNVFYRTHDFLNDISQTSDQTILILTHAFNFCHIRMLLTGSFGPLPKDGEYLVYDFSV